MEFKIPTQNTEEVISPLAGYEINSEEVQEIITAVPSWMLRWGISLIFLIILSVIAVSAVIQYPDVIKTTLKVNSLNAPKPVFSKETGKITLLLAKEGDQVKKNAPLAFMESTADHNDVLKLHSMLIKTINTLNTKDESPIITTNNLNLGELQGAYQDYYQQYLQYVSTQQGGYYLNKKKYLQKDLNEINDLRKEIIAQKAIQEQEFANVGAEYEAYKKLYHKEVISKSEYKQQENKYLSGKYTLQQSKTSLLNNSTSYSNKQKEIIELEQTIKEEKAKFIQSVNNILTKTNAWINQYVLRAPVDGIVSYAGIIQDNQTVTNNQEIFIINPADTAFFGEVHIPQYNMGKVQNGQRTLVKIRGYPFEQYGLIRGHVSYISDVAFNDSIFVAKINFQLFENKDPNHTMILKNGMLADAEIITEESSLLQRFIRNFTKMLNSN